MIITNASPSDVCSDRGSLTMLAFTDTSSDATVDPLVVLPIHRRLVEHELVNAEAHYYQLAARRLAKMCTLAAGTDQASEVDALIAGLRDTHRRRPRLQREFDRAGLP